MGFVLETVAAFFYHLGKVAQEGTKTKSYYSANEKIGVHGYQGQEGKDKSGSQKNHGGDRNLEGGGVLQCLAFRLGEFFSPSLCFNTTGV